MHLSKKLLNSINKIFIYFFHCFDSLESSSGERPKTLPSILTFPTVRIMKRSISTFSVKTVGSGSKWSLPRDPWSRWCLVHPLYFLVGPGMKLYSCKEYFIRLFIDLYLSWLRVLNPLSFRNSFRRVRINLLDVPLASARAQATNSSDEKNSGRLNRKPNSLDVNSSQSHFRNKNLKRVERFPDEITFHTITAPNLGVVKLDATLNLRHPGGHSLKKESRSFLGLLELRSLMISYRDCEGLALSSIPCTLMIHYKEKLGERRVYYINYHHYGKIYDSAL
jgi:hypothetical protein